MSVWGRRTLAVKAEYDDQEGVGVPTVIAPHGDAENRSLNITIRGTLEEQRAVADEMAQGLRCPNCIEALPEKPGLRAVAVYREAYQKNPAWLLDRMLERCARECCPFCGWEVRPEMIDLLDGGTLEDPWKDQ